ncbi:hypothetical protein [Polymorphum gilvum]|uniref:Uncharacterized protein n=1 Tax=Polymorphum gilvum (strain LMG 25793 / CGMCC 1.9160 / SL003B-26A1) TaxID=991905 RepID=F2IZY9_POLGS|nr:hypothetical protein [Polymorphum gilvum]ADZ71824.1 hypothetical protein SL003B_3402 [Polymorphum gilvum SL003B-26A1]
MYRSWKSVSFAASLAFGMVVSLSGLRAQDVPPGYEPMAPGEAYHTKFSGTTDVTAADGSVTTVIDSAGTVGEIVDVRAPGHAPDGSHWIEPLKRAPVSAAEVGQVFGIALDEAANVYLAATSAFGLHLEPGGSGWMTGMWGEGGGPGTVYRLDAANGYEPSAFAEIALDGRANSGAALGNIAFDPAHGQFFVSDLETGMIHRIALEDGRDLDHFDHGLDGRVGFLDATTGARLALPPIAFDPLRTATIDACPSGDFAHSPECWNFADFRRRVWGVGVRHDEAGAVRLYYATWANEGFGNPDYAVASEDERTNAVWSVALSADGGFDLTDVRREFLLPDFHIDAETIAERGFSSPVSDIAFPRCGAQDVMVVAERGGIRNLGLDVEAPFAVASEARALLYQLGETGVWAPIGRYDVGYYDRSAEGQPFLRANCAGGVDFAPGYDPATWTSDLGEPDDFVWISGDYLCSPEAPCRLPGVDEGDDSQVHGLQGMPQEAFDEIAPEAAYGEYPAPGPAYPPTGPYQSYLVDSDVLTDATGTLIAEEFTRNDATRIGDVEIYQVCEAPAPPPAGVIPTPVPRPVHTRTMTHRRHGSPVHTRAMTHHRQGSPVHTRAMTHRREGSQPPHTRTETHRRQGSAPPHTRVETHRRQGSAPPHTKEQTHRRQGSAPPHSKVLSHQREGSVQPHTKAQSHLRSGSQPPHAKALSHQREGSVQVHTRAQTHMRTGSDGPKIRPQQTPPVLQQQPVVPQLQVR